MDALWYLRYRRGGGQRGPLRWEFSGDLDKWEDASAPGQVGKLVLERLLGHDVPGEWARPTQNTVHWAMGLGWSAQFGLMLGLTRRSSWTWGLVFGPVVWLSSYMVLPIMKVYKPIWRYDATALAQDLSAHLVYGVTTAAVFAALERRIGHRQ
jgi:hypothetical protein